MKLLHCLKCKDLVALRRDWRPCTCGRSRGRYVDRNHALIDGNDAVAIAIGNAGFERAVESELKLREGEVINGWGGPRERGEAFKAWVIPTGAQTVGRPIPCACKEYMIEGGPMMGMVECPCGRFCYDWSMTMHCVRVIGPRERAGARASEGSGAGAGDP